MILIITNGNDFTADFLEDKIKLCDLPYYRFNTENFPQKVFLNWSSCFSKEKKEIIDKEQKRKVDLEEITVIWWRRPFDPGPQISSLIQNNKIRDFTQLQVTETIANLWDSLPSSCFWVNLPRNNYKANAKFCQLKKAKEVGFKVPDSILTNNSQEALNFINSYEKVVIKILRQKPLMFNDIYYGFFTSLIAKKDLSFIQNVEFAPVFLQEYIEKHLELRITVIGDKVFSAAVDSQSTKKGSIDWRKEDPRKQKWFSYSIPKWVENACLKIVRYFGLNFGAIDIIIHPDGHYVFLEINPNGQWVWIEMETKLPISEVFIEMFSKNLN